MKGGVYRMLTYEGLLLGNKNDYWCLSGDLLTIKDKVSLMSHRVFI